MKESTKTKLTKELIEEIIRISIGEVDESQKKQLNYFVSCIIAQHVGIKRYVQVVLMGAPEEKLLEEVEAEKSLYHFHQIMVRAFESAKAKVSFTEYQKETIICNFIQKHPDLMDLPIVDHLIYVYFTDLYVTEYQNGKAVGLLFDTYGNYANYIEASPKLCDDLPESYNDFPKAPIHTIEDALNHNPDAFCAKIEKDLYRQHFYK